MIQHLSGGAWGIFRRVFEASSRTLPLLALLFLPVVLGMGSALSRGRMRISCRRTRSCGTRRCT